MTVVRPAGTLPRASWVPSVNFWPGNKGRKAAVIHINEGGFDSSIDYMAKHGTSAHFEVGKKGKIAQLVHTDDSAWCNGLSYNPQLQRWVCPHDHVVTPTWSLLSTVDGNPNLVTCSIENEGFSGQAMAASQFDANVEILAFLGAKYPSLTPFVVGSTLIGHYHLDPRDKSNCPGNGVDLHRLAEAANAALGLDQRWRVQWAAKGVALLDDQVGWAIPQLYKANADKLGACVAGEVYPSSLLSVAVFERGFIYYVAAAKRAYLVLFAAGG